MLVYMFEMNSKTTEQIFMEFSSVERMVLEEILFVNYEPVLPSIFRKIASLSYTSYTII